MVIIMNIEKTRQIALAALFAALCCVLTMFPQIPTPATNGYVHLGDSLVLVSAWALGPVYGPLAAGIGSGFADLFSGYAHYMPATLIIKYLVALVAWFTYKAFSSLKINNIVSRVLSGILGELVMILGYFLYSALLLGDKISAALTSIPSNAVQGLSGIVVGVIVISLIKNVPQLKSWLPSLKA